MATRHACCKRGHRCLGSLGKSRRSTLPDVRDITVKQGRKYYGFGGLKAISPTLVATKPLDFVNRDIILSIFCFSNGGRGIHKKKRAVSM